MKMNDTVARIVEIMFENVEMSDEVAAIRDEVMNNCQERYQDMIARGMNADDAVAAVIESLKGMEEVIAQYPRKGANGPDEVHVGCGDGDEADDEDPSGTREYIYCGGSVRSIELTLVNEDVHVEASEDDNVHVIIDGEDVRAVTVKLKGDKLKIERTPGYERVKQNGHVFTTHKASMEIDGVQIDMEKVSGFESLGRMLGKLLKNVKFSVSDSAVDGVTIALPANWQGLLNLLTTSGDIGVEAVDCRELRAVTTNGDIRVNMDEDAMLARAEIISTSGDSDMTLFAEQMNVRTTSGDLELEGRMKNLNVSTISGDITVRADVQDFVFKAISGDLDCTFDSDELRSINGTTISGDVDIRLPEGLGRMAVSTHTISGDVTTRCHTNGVGPTVSGNIATTSGDIMLR